MPSVNRVASRQMETPVAIRVVASVDMKMSASNLALMVKADSRKQKISVEYHEKASF
ncbi:MAG TPA: hypothetical protein PKW21_08085 [Rhabdaerophilum sp.]|nr:hypothetical protein [Rhabdaerophilum sp.]